MAVDNNKCCLVHDISCSSSASSSTRDCITG